MYNLVREKFTHILLLLECDKPFNPFYHNQGETIPSEEKRIKNRIKRKMRKRK